MELYTLNSLLRRKEVVDTFESLLWKEAYSGKGEFTLVVPSNNEFRNILRAGTWLSTDVSDAAMIIDTVEDSTDDDGNQMMTVSGNSLEVLLENRFVKQTLANTTVEPKWVITGTPGNIARQLFQDICVNGIISTKDRIPFVVPGAMYPPPNVPEYAEPITVEIPLKSLYDALKEICDLYDLGFRLTRRSTGSELYFEVYSGNDRTTQQNIFPAVVFSPELENMHSPRELTTFAGEKNVAYVFSPVGFEIVYAENTDSSVSGFDRKVMVVDASDVDDEDPVLASNKMIQKGIEELAKTRPTYLFDGEVDENFNMTYGKDYRLGDLVTAQNANGVVESMKITEQIFVEDKEGFRSYPTLSVRSIIQPGTWLAWDFNQVWADLGLTDFWDNI